MGKTYSTKVISADLTGVRADGASQDVTIHAYCTGGNTLEFKHPVKGGALEDVITRLKADMDAAIAPKAEALCSKDGGMRPDAYPHIDRALNILTVQDDATIQSRDQVLCSTKDAGGKPVILQGRFTSPIADDVKQGARSMAEFKASFAEGAAYYRDGDCEVLQGAVPRAKQSPQR